MKPKLVIKPYKNGHLILRGDRYDIEQAEFFSEDGQRAARLLNERRFRIKNTGQTYRVINHWCELGLVPDQPKSRKRGWRSFSAIELAWINIVDVMRSFGLPLETIAKVRRKIFSRESRKQFEFYLMRGYEDLSYLIVFVDGDAELATQSELQSSQHHLGMANYLSINLNRIMTKLTGLSGFSDKAAFALYPTAEEIRLLILVQEGHYESITIHFREGKPERIDAMESVDASKRIIDILKEGKYQEITLKQQDGHVVSVKRTVRHKLPATATENLRASLRPSERPDTPARGADHSSNAHS